MIYWRRWPLPGDDESVSEVVPEPEADPSAFVKQRRAPRRDAWRKTAEGVAWTRGVKERDGECIECGSTERLHAHHIDKAEDKRFALENGATLCVSCHRLAHPDLPDRLFATA